MHYDFTIVGAGIVGAAASLELVRRRPGARVLLVEKEASSARHQSGHNSGVVHAGVYYEPGSLKARFCREGVRDTREFCRENGIPFRTTGKLIVATGEAELGRLEALYDRCRLNGLSPRGIDREELRELEPNVAGIRAIRVAESAITDYPAIVGSMVDQFTARGGDTRFGAAVEAIRENTDQVRLRLGGERVKTGRLLVCGGLMADRLARMQGLAIDWRTVPFRGEYFRLAPEWNDVVNHLVYPVPDPALPFLGVHLTPQVDGSVTVGPNAVPGWKREGYGKFAFSLRDTAEMLRFPGWWKLTGRHAGTGLRELWHSAWKRGYLGRGRR